MIYLAYLFLAYWIVVTIAIIIFEIIHGKELVEDLPTAIGLILIGPALVLIYFAIETAKPILNNTIWREKTKTVTEQTVSVLLSKTLKNYNKYFKRRNIG